VPASFQSSETVSASKSGAGMVRPSGGPVITLCPERPFSLMSDFETLLTT
jgi:hypothetical protein